MQKDQWCNKDNILRLAVGYQNGIVYRKPETQKRILEPTGLGKPGTSPWLMGKGLGLELFWTEQNSFSGPNLDSCQVPRTHCSQKLPFVFVHVSSGCFWDVNW